MKPVALSGAACGGMHDDEDGREGDRVVLVQLECEEHVRDCVGVNVDADVDVGLVVAAAAGENVDADEDLMQVVHVGADAGGDVDADLLVVDGL